MTCIYYGGSALQVILNIVETFSNISQNFDPNLPIKVDVSKKIGPQFENHFVSQTKRKCLQYLLDCF
jgi:hypothetical protein